MQGWRQVRCTYICTLSAASRPSNDLYLAAAHGTEIVLKNEWLERWSAVAERAIAWLAAGADGGDVSTT